LCGWGWPTVPSPPPSPPAAATAAPASTPATRPPPVPAPPPSGSSPPAAPPPSSPPSPAPPCFLAPAPVTVLADVGGPAGADLVDVLERLGIRTLGALAALPVA